MNIRLLSLVALFALLVVGKPLSIFAQLQEADDVVEIDVEDGKVTARLSPDGQRAVWVNPKGSSSQIFVATPEGSMVKEIISVTGDVTPYWLADSKRIVILHGDRKKQVVAVHSSGGKETLTDAEYGCRMLTGGPGGLVAWQSLYPREGKVNPADVIAMIDDEQKKLVERTFVTDMKFDPHGNVLAVGTAGALSFRDLAGEEHVEVKFYEHDERLFAHGPYDIYWSPEGEHISCKISFLGGREGDVKIYGDTELFVIGRDGQFSAFESRQSARETHDWIPERK